MVKELPIQFLVVVVAATSSMEVSWRGCLDLEDEWEELKELDLDNQGVGPSRMVVVVVGVVKSGPQEVSEASIPGNGNLDPREGPGKWVEVFLGPVYL